jgi:hypothetical protein
MKKKFSFTAWLLVFICASTISSAQSFELYIKNSSSVILYTSNVQDHGTDAGGDQSIAVGQTGHYSFSCGVLTGAEGTLFLNPPNDLQNQVSVHIDNPMVGKSWYFISPFHSLAFNMTATSFNKSGPTPVLTVEVTGGSGIQVKPIAVVLNAKGIISGTLYWDKRNVQGPVAYPYQQVFTSKLYAPTQFIESSKNITFEKVGTYQGKSGYFVGQKSIGNVSYTLQQSANPDYIEVKYKITGVPTEVPLDFDLQTDYNKSSWIAGPQKPKPGTDFTFVVGSFPTTSKSVVTLNNDELQIDGIDFICEGDWLQVDANGKIIGGSPMVNKIANRKEAPVLPYGSLTANLAIKTSSNQMIQAPGIQNQTQQVQVQKVRAAGAVKIRQ